MFLCRVSSEMLEMVNKIFLSVFTSVLQGNEENISYIFGEEIIRSK